MQSKTYGEQQARIEKIQAGLEAAGYTLEHVSQGGYERYFYFQAPHGAGLLVLAADPAINGYRVSLHPMTGERRDYRRAKAVKQDPAFKLVPKSEQTSVCCTAGSAVYSNGYVDVKIYGVAGHGEWVVEEKRVARPEFRKEVA